MRVKHKRKREINVTALTLDFLGCDADIVVVPAVIVAFVVVTAAAAADVVEL